MTIKQRIELDGSQVKGQLAELLTAARTAFDGIRQAAAQGGDLAKALNTDQAKQQIAQVTESIRALNDSLQTTGQNADGISRVGDASEKAGSQVEQSASKFSTFVTTLASVVGVASLVTAAIVSTAKGAADFANNVADAAVKAGVSADDFQRMGFVLEQLGAPTATAAGAIKFFSDASENAKDHVIAARLELEKLQLANTKLTDNFRIGADGIAKIDRPIKQLEGTISDLKKQLSVQSGFGFFTPQDLELQKKINAEEEKLAEAKEEREIKLQELALKTQEIAQKTKDAQQNLADAKLVQSLTSGKDELENFIKALEKVSSISDDAKRAKASLAVFGTDLSDVLGKGGQSATEFADRFKKLFGEGLGDEFVKTARNFRAASSEFKLALDFGKIATGETFLPILTDGIRKFTEFLASKRDAIKEWAESVKDGIKTLFDDLSNLTSGNGAEIQTGWLATIAQLVTGVVIPAFRGMLEAAQPVIDKINELFGTNLTVSGAAIISVLTFLVGGFNALAVAVAAVFLGQSSALDSFREKLAGLGIDVSQIKQFFIDLFNQVKQFAAGIDLRGIFAGFSAQNVATTVLEVAAAFIALRKAAILAAPFVSRVIGREISGDALLGALAIGSYTGALQALVVVLVGLAAVTTIVVNGIKLIGLAVTAVAAFFSIPIAAAVALVAAIATAAVLIVAYWDEIKSAGIAAWDAVSSAASTAWQLISSGFSALVEQISAIAGNIYDALTQPFRDAWNYISDLLDKIAAKIRGAIALLSGLTSGSSGEGGSTGPGGAPFAAGGYTGNMHPARIAGVVHGREYVQPASVVARPGVLQFMELLRRVGDLPTAIGYFTRGYSGGGFVQSVAASLSPAALPGFSGGGFVPAPAFASRHMGSLDLVVRENGRELGRGRVFADPQEILRLTGKAATKQALARAGNPPSWER